MGEICIVLAVLSLLIIIVLKFSNEYKDRNPGVLSRSIYKISTIFNKKEKAPASPEFRNLEGVLLTEQEEKTFLSYTVVCLCLLSFASGLLFERFKGDSLWVPGGILLSAYNLFMLYPALALLLTLITFLMLLKLREKRLKSNNLDRRDCESAPETRLKQNEKG